MGIIETENITEENVAKVNKWITPLLWSIFALFLVCYIIALIRVRKSSMVVFVNWYDFGLMVAACIIGVIGAIISNTTAQIILLVVSGICMLSSLIWTIIANKEQGSVSDTIVAIFAKIFVMAIFWIMLLYIIRPRRTTKTVSGNGQSYTRKLSEYEQMREDAKHSRNSKIAIGIVGFLILSLVGNGEYKDLVNKLKSKV